MCACVCVFVCHLTNLESAWVKRGCQMVHSKCTEERYLHEMATKMHVNKAREKLGGKVLKCSKYDTIIDNADLC